MRSPLVRFGALALVAAGAVASSGARADTPSRATELRAAADAFATDGDLARARATLSQLRATPAELLAALREVAKPATEMVGGTRTLELTDDRGRTTEVILYAPETEKLRARTKPLGLVCLLHGLGGKARNANQFAERLVATGEFACVAPSAKPLAPGENSTDDGIPAFIRSQFKNWWGYDSPHSFTLEAIRKAREQLWIDPDRITLGGVSMGGYGTWNIGLRRPDHFAGLVPLAGEISRIAPVSEKDPVSLALLENGRTTPVMAGHGINDPLVPIGPDREACERLRAIGGTATFLAIDVGHTPEDLKKAFEGPLLDQIVTFVVTAKRQTSPTEVTYVSLAESLDGAHWLRILERSPRGVRPKVKGRIDGKENRISVESDGVRRTRVYLDERLLDSTRDVEVRSGGRVAWRGRIEPSLEAILESWRSRRDPGLVYPAFVDVGPTYR